VSRISSRFAALKAAKKKAFISFISAGDPDVKTYAALLAGLPKAGVDLIEIGVPFSDPVADGPSIERGNLRAFKAGITLAKIFGLVTDFRKKDSETPIVLMGYANPVYSYGLEKYTAAAKKAGVDGLIVADLPPEEDSDLRAAAKAQGIDVIHFITPTTDVKRLDKILPGAGGFLYYVSVAGTTGSKQAVAASVRRAIEMIRPHSKMPVAVGFGISTPAAARAIAETSDAVIVGSAIVDRIAANLDAKGKTKPGLVKDVLGFVETLAKATHEK
jgi:tryptophan synthase alpha chain